jgi:hypothetical protein
MTEQIGTTTSLNMNKLELPSITTTQLPPGYQDPPNPANYNAAFFQNGTPCNYWIGGVPTVPYPIPQYIPEVPPTRIIHPPGFIPYKPQNPPNYNSNTLPDGLPSNYWVNGIPTVSPPNPQYIPEYTNQNRPQPPPYVDSRTPEEREQTKLSMFGPPGYIHQKPTRFIKVEDSQNILNDNIKDKMEAERTHKSCKYATREEAIEANKQKARERYWKKRDEILQQKKTDPIIKEKRKQQYLQRKQKEEQLKLEHEQLQMQQLLLYQQLQQYQQMLQYQQTYQPQSMTSTPNFTLEIVH